MQCQDVRAILPQSAKERRKKVPKNQLKRKNNCKICGYTVI